MGQQKWKGGIFIIKVFFVLLMLAALIGLLRFFLAPFCALIVSIGLRWRKKREDKQKEKKDAARSVNLWNTLREIEELSDGKFKIFSTNSEGLQIVVTKNEKNYLWFHSSKRNSQELCMSFYTPDDKERKMGAETISIAQIKSKIDKFFSRQ